MRVAVAEVVLPDHPELVDAPPQLERSDNATLISAYAYPRYFSIPNGTTVRTTAVDFYRSGGEIDSGSINRLVNDMATYLGQPRQVNPHYLVSQQIVAYFLYGKPVFGVHVPQQICIPLTDLCWTPPGAGAGFDTVFFYRLWILTIPRYIPVGLKPGIVAVPVLGFWGIIAYGIVAILLLVTLVAVVKIATGEMKIEQLTSEVHSWLKAPGENAAEATSFIPWAFAGMGLVMIAGGIFLPQLSTSLGATLPIPGGGAVKAGVGSGGASGVPRRRR